MKYYNVDNFDFTTQPRADDIDSFLIPQRNEPAPVLQKI